MLYTIFKVTSPNIILNNSAVLSFNAAAVHCAGWVQLVSVCAEPGDIIAEQRCDPIRSVTTHFDASQQKKGRRSRRIVHAERHNRGFEVGLISETMGKF